MKVAELTAVQTRLSQFVEEFADCFGRSERRHWAKVYLSGLLLDGERKSIEPIAARVSGGNEQALQQFINQSPWDDMTLVAKMRKHVLSKLKIGDGVAVLDDTSLPKKGKHSVGVAHQYCGALGKLANCQSLVTWQFAANDFHIPLCARLYLPEEWTSDDVRLTRAGVPEDRRTFREKWKIALELLDELRDDCPVRCVTFDAGYGGNRVFLRELDDRGMNFVGQTNCAITYWRVHVPLLKPTKTGAACRGRPVIHVKVADEQSRPVTAHELADDLFADARQVKILKLRTLNPRCVEYVATRVYETIARPFHRVGPGRWFIAERLSDGSRKYYVANHSEDSSPEEILLMAHERWKVEQGYQQLKEELGLDHFEGRSWRGLHHHVSMCFMAFNFLQLLRSKRGKKGVTILARNEKNPCATHQADGVHKLRKVPNLAAITP